MRADVTQTIALVDAYFEVAGPFRPRHDVHIVTRPILRADRSINLQYQVLYGDEEICPWVDLEDLYRCAHASLDWWWRVSQSEMRIRALIQPLNLLTAEALRDR